MLIFWTESRLDRTSQCGYHNSKRSDSSVRVCGEKVRSVELICTSCTLTTFYTKHCELIRKPHRCVYSPPCLDFDVHSGIDQFPDDESDMDQPPSDDELDYDMSDADSELDDSDEEEEPKAAAKPESKKRAHDADASEAAEKLSKKQKKQKKAASGEAVPAGGAEEPADAKKSKKAKDSSAKEEKQPEVKGKGVERVLAGGVKISDHKVGSGPKAKKGDTVSMRYIGKLANGKLFDSNTKGKAVSFTSYIILAHLNDFVVRVQTWNWSSHQR